MFRFEVVTVDGLGRPCRCTEGWAESRYDRLTPDVVLEMVRIPGGRFTMGSPETEAGRTWYQVWDQSLAGLNIEGPEHEVQVSEFWLGKYPVTQAQWRVVAGLPMVNGPLNPEPSHFRGDDRPVEQVSWYEAMEFCDRLSQYSQQQYRLPTEAEWEYACRAGTTTPFHYGPTITPDLANYAPIAGEHQGYHWSGAYGDGPQGCYRQATTAVGSFPPNGFGLYDLHGNVWEWCFDDWHPGYEGAPRDGSAWRSPDGEKRILRGGSWYFFPDLCRSAFRNRRTPETRLNRTGFRLAGNGAADAATAFFNEQAG
ncbi:formylglycine-generating enzyme family protein [Spirulina sp. CCNP1310]|uniref:formylglycine-generating enzyme family protein n=1 Tax=Spirulina sp. CCNP1310 TaxID=3110249 RepID=UPI002B21668C|nr:formylglycine-generating enzyme family protein [Spirulina sp. CCNP1310]